MRHGIPAEAAGKRPAKDGCRADPVGIDARGAVEGGPLVSYEQFLLALCAWREARSEGYDGMLAVCSTVMNRVMRPGFPKTIGDVVLQPRAFSSFNRGDPNAAILPRPSDEQFTAACAAAMLVTSGRSYNDPTDGAVFYFSPPVVAPPIDWGAVAPTTRVGRLSFYRTEGAV
jgi:spore germination cell wall hydrolase CwlJ-like protein